MIRSWARMGVSQGSASDLVAQKQTQALVRPSPRSPKKYQDPAKASAVHSQRPIDAEPATPRHRCFPPVG